MARFSAKIWIVPIASLLMGAGDITAPEHFAAFAQQTATPSNKSWTDSVSSGFKRGFTKVGNALNPKAAANAPRSEDDAISLTGKGKPGPDLYVAVARLYVQSGKLADAEQQYQLALKERPNHLPALLGYAQLKEQLGQPNDAIRIYQRAAKAYPNQAAVHNNMGLCYARQGRLDEAVAAMTLAVQLVPKSPLFCNNIATVLVDQGKYREAFGYLNHVHGEAAAYYNMGYLLNKKKQTQAAMQHFALALRADPSMAPAKRWIEYLEKTTTQARLPPQDKNLLMPPEAPMARRLPPIPSKELEPDGTALPGISFNRNERPAVLEAPLPPPTNSAIRPLPRVN